MAIPEGYKFLESHEWVKVEDDVALVGISEHAAEQLGEIVFVELPEEDDEVSAGEVVANIESAKAVGEVKSPVSGEIVEVNFDLEDEPEMINEAPFESYLFKVKISDSGELDDLLDADAYEKTL
jgi:glycine cleavage system H protein